MRKILIILFALLMVGCTSNEQVNDKTTQPTDVVKIDKYEVAEAFNVLLKAGDYEGMHEFDYSKEMETFLEENDLGDVFEQLDLGVVVEQQTIKESEQSGFIILSTPTIFESKSLDVNLVFDAENKISGFNVGQFTGDLSTTLDVDALELGIKHHQAFADQNLESLVEDFDYTEQMNKVIEEGLFENDITSERYGALVEVKEGYTFEVSGYLVVSIPVVYESKSFNYDLALDNNGKIAGLSFSEFAEKTLEVDNEKVTEIALNADVNDMSLPGILTVPSEGDNFPVVVLVHGSGASDKDETIMQNKPFRDIAWGLAERGIASYRYDKSVFAYPEKFQDNFEMTLYDETVNDAVEIFKMVKELEQINPNQVYILGHSLGGHAIPLIAEGVDATGYVIMAGNVRSLDELMIEQIDYLLNLDEIMTDDEQAYLDKFTLEVEKLNQMDALKDDEIILGAYKAYWAFLKNYDPIEKADAIDKSVLVLQGERDYQVTMVDYELWHSEFESKDNWSFKTYETLNHLMISGEGKPSNEEYMKAGIVSEEVIKDVSEWIKGNE